MSHELDIRGNIKYEELTLPDCLQGLAQQQSLRQELFEEVMELYSRTLKISATSWGENYFTWAAKREGTSGLTYSERVRFWASQKTNMAACPFVTKRGQIILPLGFMGEDDNETMVAYNLFQRKILTYHIGNIMPIFDRNLKRATTLSNKDQRFLSVIMSKMGRWCEFRAKVLQEAYYGVNEEPMSELDGWAGAWESKKPTPNQKRLVQDFVRKGRHNDVEDALAYAKIANQTKEEKTTMTKSETVAANMISANKKAAKDLAYLNGGRVANKTIKMAMSPLLRLILKPSWLQKAAMKLTGTKNPVDAFMDSPISDLLAAQSFKLVLELKGVTDERLQETANSAIVYAGLQVTEELPIEDMMDDAVAKVAATVQNMEVFDKLTKKD